jgi:hypothetical protein
MFPFNNVYFVAFFIIFRVLNQSCYNSVSKNLNILSQQTLGKKLELEKNIGGIIFKKWYNYALFRKGYISKCHINYTFVQTKLELENIFKVYHSYVNKIEPLVWGGIYSYCTTFRINVQLFL